MYGQKLRQVGQIAFNSATAYTENVSVLLAAPGAGLRYRIFDIIVGYNFLADNSIAVNLRARFGASAPFDMAHLYLNPNKLTDHVSLEQGYTLATNQNLVTSWQSNDNQTTTGFYWVIIYWVETSI